MILRILSTALFICCINSISYCQDVLTKSDGTTINVKIMEINDDAIKYKKSDNPDGPTYSILLIDVDKVNYKNGSVDVFNKEKKEESSEGSGSKGDSKGGSGSFDINNENTVKKVEALAKYAGESILAKCTGKPDNSVTEVFYDGVFQDDGSKDITIPIKVSWQPRSISGDRKWIRGVVKVSPDGKKTWTYQNDSGGWFGGCAKHLKDL